MANPFKGLLVKLNPESTVRSKLTAAGVMATLFVAIAVVLGLLEEPRRIGKDGPVVQFFGWPMAVWMAIAGGITGAAMDHQTPSDDDEETNDPA